MTASLFAIEDRAAEISPCGTYRYQLKRRWDDGKCVAWLMLNPSTADALQDDATIRKCMGFSKRWGYGRMIVVNLFALRSTDPRALVRNTDPVGIDNDYWIIRSLKDGARECICAWGCQQHLTTPKLRGRIRGVMELFGKDGVCGFPPAMCLGYRKDGAPRHPLILAYETPREPFVESQ